MLLSKITCTALFARFGLYVNSLRYRGLPETDLLLELFVYKLVEVAQDRILWANTSIK